MGVRFVRPGEAGSEREKVNRTFQIAVGFPRILRGQVILMLPAETSRSLSGQYHESRMLSWYSRGVGNGYQEVDVMPIFGREEIA